MDWVLDTGASSNVVPCRKWLQNIVKVNITARGAFGTKFQITEQGTLELILDNGNNMRIAKVLFCSELDQPLLSIHQLILQGYHFKFTTTGYIISYSGTFINSARFCTNAYILSGKPVEVVQQNVDYQKMSPDNELQTILCMSMDKDVLQHLRFGHTSYSYLYNAGLIRKYSRGRDHHKFCMGCALGKLKGYPTKKYIPEITSVFIATLPAEKTSYVPYVRFSFVY